MWNKIILKLFQCFYFTFETEIKLFWPVKEFWNKIISATLNMLENIHELKFILQNNFEIISGKFLRAEIKLFPTEVDEGWNNFEIILFQM